MPMNKPQLMKLSIIGYNRKFVQIYISNRLTSFFFEKKLVEFFNHNIFENESILKASPHYSCVVKFQK